MTKKIEVKSILNKKKNRDPWFLDDYTVNPYSGCSMNCSYCYIRGSKYGTNLEQNMSIKSNAIELLDRQLYNRAKKGQFGIIALSSATDPYVSIEAKEKLTRSLLKIILKYQFPVHIFTKSTLVERDFDLLQQIDNKAILPTNLKFNRGAILTYSFSSLDENVGKRFEPGAPLPMNRLTSLNNARKANLFSGVSMMPLLPFISDTGENLEYLFKTFKAAGAQYLFPATLTVYGNNPYDSKYMILTKIKHYYPHLEEKYISYFRNSNEMPSYYRRAFENKMKELSTKYSIPLHLPHSY